MVFNRFILLFLLLFVCVGEEPQRICHPSTPFKKIDQTCGSFNDICVKTDNEDCNYFQKACQQCPPTNYTVLMFIDISNIKNQMNRTNLNLVGIKDYLEQINYSIKSLTKNLSGYMNTIIEKSTKQGIVIVCLIFILIHFILTIVIFRKEFKCLLKRCEKDEESGEDKQGLLSEQLIIILDEKFQTITNENEKFQTITNENKEFFKDMKKEINEKDEKFQTITNENKEFFKDMKKEINEKVEKFQTISNENKELFKDMINEIKKKDASSKLRFQLVNQFDETELFVSKFDSVIKLKKSICDRNMNTNDYKRMIMRYKGATLDNNQYLLSCIDSTNIPIICEFDNNVDFNAMIVIKLKCDNIYPEMIQIGKHQQIKDLKNIISKLNKTNHKDLLIVYKSNELDDDDKTIDDYKIEDNDWIQVANKSEQMGNITMKSIFSAKETISIEFSKFKTVSDIIKKCKQKMATNHFAVFLNKKPLQNDKLIYEYNIDSKSLVEFCYFKSMDYIKEMSRLSNLHNIILYQATYHYESIDKPILLKGYNKSIMEKEYDYDLSRILREELEIFQITKSHPRFMQLFDIYMNNEWIFIGMENSTKIPMKSFLSNNNDVSAYLMSKWANQMLEGLKHLHNHNIIMKDMNPMDMWIDGNHDVKLPSFNMTGYLDHLNDDESDKYKHKDGILVYVAPEILESKPYEASVDVWSLGVIMIEVITGAQLFPGLNESEAVRKIKESHINEYDKTNKPKDLINFIDCCVKKDPKERATIDKLIKMEFIEKYLS